MREKNISEKNQPAIFSHGQSKNLELNNTLNKESERRLDLNRNNCHILLVGQIDICREFNPSHNSNKNRSVTLIVYSDTICKIRKLY